MTSCYGLPDDARAKGIDYDLCACLRFNPQSTFTLDDIDTVLAVWEGENNGPDWRWIIRLTDGRIVYLQGGCDFTGWDCQSSAWSKFAGTPEAAAEYAVGGCEFETAEFCEGVRQSLLAQLAEGKAQTWRERTDGEMGLTGGAE